MKDTKLTREEEQEFELDYCPICIQATNHGCCKCASKKGRASQREDDIKEFKEFLSNEVLDMLSNSQVRYLIKAFAEEFEKQLGGMK